MERSAVPESSVVPSALTVLMRKVGCYALNVNSVVVFSLVYPLCCVLMVLCALVNV